MPDKPVLRGMGNKNAEIASAINLLHPQS